MVELDWIHIVIAIVATALATLGFSGLARKRGKRKAAAPLHPKPPPPEKTADEHSTELELSSARAPAQRIGGSVDSLWRNALIRSFATGLRSQ